MRAPIQAVELGELLSCIPGLAHEAAARESEAITAPKTMLIRAAPMITPLELTWITGMKDSSPVTVDVAAHQLLATTKPISPSPAPVQAPTLMAVRTRRRSDTGSRTTSGSGSTITAAAAGATSGCAAGSGSGSASGEGPGSVDSSAAGAGSSVGVAAGAGADPAGRCSTCPRVQHVVHRCAVGGGPGRRRPLHQCLGHIQSVGGCGQQFTHWAR